MRPGPGPWVYGQPCVVTSDKPTEVVYRGSPGSTYGIVVLDNELYISTDDGILREDGEMFIPTSGYPMYITANNGYLYWLEHIKQGKYSLYASLGKFDTARQIDTIISYGFFRLVAARGGVTITSWSDREFLIWSARGPREEVKNCFMNWDNGVSMVASKEHDLLWGNRGGSFCWIHGKDAPTAFVPHKVTIGIAIDEEDLYWAVAGTEMTPSQVYRRPIRGGDATLIANVGPIGSDLVVDGDSIFWKGDHRLERAPTSSKNEEGKETLACDVDDYAVSDDYVYWKTATNLTNATMKARR